MDDLGVEPDRDLVELAVEDGGTIVDGDLTDQDDVGGDVGIDGNLGHPLSYEEAYSWPLDGWQWWLNIWGKDTTRNKNFSNDQNCR